MYQTPRGLSGSQQAHWSVTSLPSSLTLISFLLLPSSDPCSGSIPESLGRCVGLATLSLSDNRLSGQLLLLLLPSSDSCRPQVNFPNALRSGSTSKSSSSTTINSTVTSSRATPLRLTGPLPNSIGKCVNLRQLSIADNELSGHSFHFIHIFK